MSAMSHDEHLAKYESTERKLIILRTLSRVMIWLAAGATGIVMFYAGPRLEVVLYPVVPTFIIEDIDHAEDGDAIITGVMYKAYGREHCYPESIAAYTTDGTEPSRRVDIEFEPTHADGHQWRVRPAGSQVFGPWRLQRPGPPIGPILVVQVTHRCHALWSVTQDLYRGLSEDFFPGQVVRP
jgi:hypothetical protein